MSDVKTLEGLKQEYCGVSDGGIVDGIGEAVDKVVDAVAGVISGSSYEERQAARLEHSRKCSADLETVVSAAQKSLNVSRCLGSVGYTSLFCSAYGDVGDDAEAMDVCEASIKGFYNGEDISKKYYHNGFVQFGHLLVFLGGGGLHSYRDERESLLCDALSESGTYRHLNGVERIERDYFILEHVCSGSEMCAADVAQRIRDFRTASQNTSR